MQPSAVTPACMSIAIVSDLKLASRKNSLRENKFLLTQWSVLLTLNASPAGPSYHRPTRQVPLTSLRLDPVSANFPVRDHKHHDVGTPLSLGYSCCQINSLPPPPTNMTLSETETTVVCLAGLNQHNSVRDRDHCCPCCRADDPLCVRVSR